MAKRRKHSRKGTFSYRQFKRPSKKSVGSALRLGGKGLVNFAVGGALLAGVRRLPNFAGKYQGAVDKIIVGGGTRLVGLKGQSDMLTAGIKEGFADVLDLEILPRLSGGLGGLLGGGGSQAAPAAPLINRAAYSA